MTTMTHMRREIAEIPDAVARLLDGSKDVLAEAGRGVRERLKKGEYKLLDDGQHAISRIHIDDVARIVFAAEDKAPTKSKYPGVSRRLILYDSHGTGRTVAFKLSRRRCSSGSARGVWIEGTMTGLPSSWALRIGLPRSPGSAGPSFGMPV